MSVDMILAKGYVSITNRKTHLDDVRRELSIIVNCAYISFRHLPVFMISKGFESNM